MDKENNAPILDELPIPEAKAPEKTEYETDILVIGGGWAGITAAAHAKELGGNVMLVDKGTPGYSGLMPWSHTYKWADPELENEEDFVSAMPFVSEYTANPEIERLYPEGDFPTSDGEQPLKMAVVSLQR